MTELKMEHVLMFVIVAFLLYHFMGRCSCNGNGNNGFNVGGQIGQTYPLFPLDKKASPSFTGPCGYAYENSRIMKNIPFLECLDDDVCLCRSDNSVIKTTKSDPNLCMPPSGRGLGSECYKRNDIQIAKKYLTDISKSL